MGMSRRLLAVCCALLLPACGATIRQVPASLDPSNPQGPEAVDPPRVAEAEPAEQPAPPHGGHTMEGMPGHEMPGDSAPDGGAHGDDSMGGMNMGPPNASPKAPAKPATVTYTCPMHPEVVSPKKGTCPKCGMTLVPRKPTAKQPAHGDHSMGDMDMGPKGGKR